MTTSKPPLPPVGKVGEDDHAVVVGYLNDLARESVTDRDEWADWADRNQNIFAYGEDPPPASLNDGKIRPNEIQRAVLSNVNIQTKEPPTVVLDPVETGEPGEWYWSGPPEIGMRFGILPEQMESPAPPVDPMTGQPFALPSPLPLEELQGMAVQKMISMGQLPPGQVLQPNQSTADPMAEPVAVLEPIDQWFMVLQEKWPELAERWVSQVNDKTVSDVYQAVFDVFWQRTRTDAFIRETLIDCNIEGWADGLYEFDQSAKLHVLKQMSIRQVYIDPTVKKIEDAAYAGIDFVLDAAEAKKLYPHLAESIDEHATTGQVSIPSEVSQLGGQFDGRTFERPMVTLRIFWIRNQDAPVEETSPEGIEAITADPEGAVQYLADDENGGRPMINPAWPTRKIVRQMTVIDEAAVVVDDRECEHWDIPLCHLRNIPVGKKPWAQGDPMRLKGLQDAKQRGLKSVVDHLDLLAHPVSALSRTMANELGWDKVKKLHIRPGDTLIVDDMLYQQMGGKVTVFTEAPPLSPGVPQALEILDQTFSTASGFTETVQGRAEPGVKSGKHVELLQEAAVSEITGYRSQELAEFVYRLSRLMLHALVKWLDVDDLMRVVSKYPRHVMEAVRARAERLEWDVSVTISSGNGQVRFRKVQERIQQFQLGLVSRKTVQEEAGIDDHRENQRQRDEVQQQAMMGMGPALGSGPQQEGEKKEKPKGS